MAQIRVIIKDPAGSKATPVELPDDVPMSRLIPALVTKMSLPTSQGGEPLNYGVDHVASGKRLRNEDTLASADVREGDKLELIPIIIAGCFLVGTKIARSSTVQIDIEQVNANEEVLTFDLTSRLMTAGTVIGIFRGFADEYLVLNETLKITGSHMVCANETWLPASMLQVGDRLVTVDGQTTYVVTMERVRPPEPVEVYNLHLVDNHTFFADGVLVHNADSKGLRLEESLLIIEISGEDLIPVQIRLTPDDFFPRSSTLEAVTKITALAYLLMLLAGTLWLWVTHPADKSIALKVAGLILLGSGALYAGRLHVLASYDLRQSVSRRAAILLFVACLVLCIELVLVIIW